MSMFEEMSKDLLRFSHYPAAMQTICLNRLSDAQNGVPITLSDPTDPVVYIAEMGVMLGHTTIEGMRELIPKVYPSEAQSVSDLYRHISDRDLLDVFAQPGTSTLMLYIDIDSLMSRAMPLISTGVRRVIIPRDTVFKVSGYEFAIQYPIEIRVLPYATATNYAFQVIWLTDIESPIAPVSTNALEWNITSAPGVGSDIMVIRIPVMQYAVASYSDTVTPGSAFEMIRDYTNSYFTARVWMKRDNSSAWVELKTTMSQGGYNIYSPTAVLQVIDGKIKVRIPAIYMNEGLVDGTIRVDIYTTVGAIDVDLSSFDRSNFSFGFRDLNGEIDPTYTNPFKQFSIRELISDTRATGGRAAVSFNELMTMVIDNAVGARRIPITPSQLSTASKDYGFSMTRPVDFVTARMLHMSADVPASTIETVASPIGTVTAPMYFTLDELQKLTTVRINGNRTTITPDTLYRFDGTCLAFDAVAVERFKSLSGLDLVTYVNLNKRFYTPFYYVVDVNNNAIGVRVYHLDAPKVKGKRFVDANITTSLSAVTDDYQFFRRGDDYVLRVLTKSDNAYQSLSDTQVFVQALFEPRNSNGVKVAINGELVGKQGKERVFDFVFDTNLDIDRNNELVLKDTINLAGVKVDTPAALIQDFNIVYGCVGVYQPNFSRSEIDDLLMSAPRDAMGITHEVFTLKFGDALDAYWRKSRPVTDSINYQYYQEDIYDYYAEDVLQLDANDVPVYILHEGQTPPIEFVYEHRKGDVKLDAEGQPVVLHRKGSQVFVNGAPVIDKPRSIKFRVEMITFDARYLAATNAAVAEYREAVVVDVVERVTEVLPKMKSDLLEETVAYYRPPTTMGYISVRKEDGTVAPMSAEHQVIVKYYMSAADRENVALLKTIRNITAKVTNEYLNTNQTISTTALGSLLKDAIGSSIIAAEVVPFGENQDMRVFTVIGDASSATLSKKLDIEADGTLTIKDDIVISYNRHDVAPAT